MQANTRAIIQSTFDASNEGRIHFGTVIGQLMSANVEAYHVDYRSGRTTYYLIDGETLDLDFELPANNIGNNFDVNAVRSAIAGAQRGVVVYPAFKHRTQQAGCIGYMVWIAGRHVTYYGRKGESHIERFPD